MSVAQVVLVMVQLLAAPHDCHVMLSHRFLLILLMNVQECDDHATWFRTEALPAKDMQEALRLQWHNLVPQDPPPGGLFQPPLCFSDAALQVMQLSAFHAEGQPSTSRAYSEASGDRHTSSTGFSHSPPRSPRLKRPGSRNTNLEYTIDSYHNTEGVVSDRLSPDTDQKPHPLRQASTSHLQPDAPETIDTPDHGHDHAARNIFCKSEPRERAASSVYGLRRLRASPRWAAESAHMSDASLSEGQLSCLSAHWVYLERLCRQASQTCLNLLSFNMLSQSCRASGFLNQNAACPDKFCSRLSVLTPKEACNQSLWTVLS